MMRRYIIKFLVLAAIYFVFMLVLRSVTPKYLGNVQLTQKMQFFEKEQEKVNTVFLGNSHINRHIDPVTFDKFTNNNTYSYNLACDATPMMERSFLLEWFLDNYKVDRIFFQVGHSADIREENLNTLRVVYYHDLRRLLYATKYRSDKPLEILNHVFAFLKNQLSFFRLKELLQFKKIQSAAPPQFESHRGFLAIDKDDGRPFQQPGFAKKSEKYIGIFDKLKRKRDLSKLPMKSTDPAVIEECKRLQKLTEAAGVELIFLFSPNMYQYYQYGLENSVYMGDGSDFKMYYEFQNHYDMGHLNSVGAQIFTRRLARIYNAFEEKKGR